MICRMNLIHCEFANGDGYCVLSACCNPNIVGNTIKHEEQNREPMTNSQLAEWCAKGCGQWKHNPSNSGTVYHTYWVIEGKENCFVEDNIVIRPWGTHEWIKPTLGIYEKSVEEKKK